MGGSKISDAQDTTNERVPYQLTQDLLPFLTNAKGQVVFINSSAGLSAKGAEIGQYAATKHALRAIADSLRDEANPKNNRVLSVLSWTNRNADAGNPVPSGRKGLSPGGPSAARGRGFYARSGPDASLDS